MNNSDNENTQEIALENAKTKGLHSFIELSDQHTGLLWLINRVVFHPRGYALSLCVDEETKQAIGWQILGDGKEVWTFSEEVDDIGFAKSNAFFESLTSLEQNREKPPFFFIEDEHCSECHGMALGNNLERPCHNCHSYHSGFYPPEICVDHMRNILYMETNIPVADLSDEEIIKTAYIITKGLMENRNFPENELEVEVGNISDEELIKQATLQMLDDVNTLAHKTFTEKEE